MQIGGVTVFGLPDGLPIWVDSRVMERERIVLGGGSRSWKVIASPCDPACPAGGRGRRGPGQRTRRLPHDRAPSVRLRPVEDDDLPIFLAHQDDPIAAAMAAFPTRAPDVFYEHWATIRADPTNYTRTIVADGEVVGDIVSWLDDGRRQVGYWIGRDHWGKGFATAALRLCSRRSRTGR